MKSLHVRLHAYTPFGASLGILPQPTEFDASNVHDDDGAINVTYSRHALGGDILTRSLESGLEIAIEVSDGTGYVEPRNMRYLVTGRSSDATDESDTVRLTGPSISWLMSKILNNDTSRLIADGDNKGKRAFLSSTPGTIISTILGENKARGGSATGLSWDFDTAKDSSGVKWANVYTLYYSLGTSLQSMLASMVGGAAVDWRTTGRKLSVWNADNTALSRDLSGSVTLALSRDVGDAPNDESISELASDILVAGDNGLVFRQSNPAAPTPWGKWESYVSQGGVSDEGTAKAFMQATLESSARVRGQYTRTLLVHDVDSLPLVDYMPGDWITAPTVNHGERTRIQQVTVSLDSEGKLSASIILNDIRQDASVREAKKMAGITGGATLAGSEGGRPAPENDHRQPAAPTGLVVATSAYLDANGYARGLASAQWAKVETASDGSAQDISQYQVQWRLNVAGAPWHAAGVTDGLTLSWSPLDCGSTIAVRVRAMPSYSDQPGVWSAETVVTVEDDTTPPSVPSKPVATSDLAVIKIHWDGLTSTGAHMEMDFDHLEVGQGSGANNLTVISTNAVGSGDYLVIGLTVGATYTFALRAVDHVGNTSGWSATTQVTVDSAVRPEDLKDLDDDLAANTTAITQAQKDITANKTAIGEANQTLSTVQTDLGKAKTDLSQAQKDISSNSSAITQANKDLTQAKSDITANNTALSQAQKDITANATKITTVQSDVTKAKSDIAANSTALSKAQSDITANSSAITQANKDLTQAKSDLSKAKTDIASNSSAIGKAQTDITAAASKAQSALDKANTVGTTVDGLHNIFTGPDDPTTLSNAQVRIGDTWRRTQPYWTRWNGDPGNSVSLLADFYTYWEGEPDNSPSVLVTLDSRIVDVSVWDGLRWNAVDLIARNVLATGTITGDLVAANTIRGDSLIAGSVTTGQLAAQSVTTDRLAANAVTIDKLAANSVNASKIVAGAVTTDKLAANSVTAGQLAADSVTSAAIKALSVTADDLAANSVNASKIVSGAITTDKLAANSVTADQLAANSVTSAAIKALSITVDDLAADSIDASKIVSGAVTTDALAADSVTAGKIVAGSITGDRLAASTITAREIKASSITSDLIAAGQFVGYVFTGAVFRSSDSDPKTELTSSGLHVTDASGADILRLGYGIPTGLAVRDPLNPTGDMIPLSLAALSQPTLGTTATDDTKTLLNQTGVNTYFDYNTASSPVKQSETQFMAGASDTVLIQAGTSSSFTIPCEFTTSVNGKLAAVGLWGIVISQLRIYDMSGNDITSKLSITQAGAANTDLVRYTGSRTLEMTYNTYDNVVTLLQDNTDDRTIVIKGLTPWTQYVAATYSWYELKAYKYPTSEVDPVLKTTTSKMAVYIDPSPMLITPVFNNQNQ